MHGVEKSEVSVPHAPIRTMWSLDCWYEGELENFGVYAGFAQPPLAKLRSAGIQVAHVDRVAGHDCHVLTGRIADVGDMEPDNPFHRILLHNRPVRVLTHDFDFAGRSPALGRITFAELAYMTVDMDNGFAYLVDPRRKCMVEGSDESAQPATADRPCASCGCLKPRVS